MPAHVFRWRSGAPDNPYWGYLALADAFVVTGDSISMLAEACATGKPVFVFDPGRASELRRDPAAAIRRRVMYLGIPRLGRDLRRIHGELVRDGHAAFLGELFGARKSPPPDSLERAVGAVRSLFPSGPRYGRATQCARLPNAEGERASAATADGLIG